MYVACAAAVCLLLPPGVAGWQLHTCHPRGKVSAAEQAVVHQPSQALTYSKAVHAYKHLPVTLTRAAVLVL
jgi:hypothetical protein